MIAYIDIRDKKIKINEKVFTEKDIVPKEDFIYFRRSGILDTYFHKNPKYEDWMFPYLLTRDYKGKTLFGKILSKNPKFYKNFGKSPKEAFENLYNDPSVREIIKLENLIFKDLFEECKENFLRRRFLKINSFEYSIVNKIPFCHYEGYFIRVVGKNPWFEQIFINHASNYFRPNPKGDVRKIKFYPPIVFNPYPTLFSELGGIHEIYLGICLNVFIAKEIFLKEVL
ncbi:MAG: hypothetical protein QW350_04140 [Candidatus Aenigmatarchaeota archaeon]